MTNAALRGKPDAGNPHVRFDEGEVAPAATPRRGSLLYKTLLREVRKLLGLPESGLRTSRGSIFVSPNQTKEQERNANA